MIVIPLKCAELLQSACNNADEIVKRNPSLLTTHYNLNEGTYWMYDGWSHHWYVWDAVEYGWVFMPNPDKYSLVNWSTIKVFAKPENK